MVSGIATLAGLCLVEIILAKIALIQGNNEEFNFEDFFDLKKNEKS